MKQRGRNEKYPNEIKIWKLGDPVPSWLSDLAKVKKIKQYGSIVIDIIMIDRGGFEIKDPTNQLIAKTTNNSDFICFGDKKIFVLTEKQLNLLYYD